MHIVTNEDKAKVKQYLNEAVKATLRKNDEQAHIRDILKTLKEQHDIEPKVARKTLRTMLAGNKPEIQEEAEQLELLLEIAGV